MPLTIRDIKLPPWLADVTRTQWFALAVAIIALYTIVRSIYLLYFHPLSKYPGPKLAAVSDLWYAYHTTGGKWPYAVENAMKKYGDVVRIGPNELCFIEPQAIIDIHSARSKGAGAFVKTDLDGLGDKDNGLTWERDPAKHREVAKSLSPAFSAKSIKSKEPTMQKHMDIFINKMKELGTADKGIDLRRWTEWLAMDLSSDLAYNREMHQMTEMKSNPFLTGMLGANFLGSLIGIMKKYPIVTPFLPLFVPWSVLRSLPSIIKDNRVEVQKRIDRRGNTKHPDYFDQLLPADKPAPTNTKELRHLRTIAGQLVLGGFDPVSGLFFTTIFFLLKNPEILDLLTKEIRTKFQSYRDIEPDNLLHFQYLNACLQETLRLNATATQGGLPRVCPGAVVNGEYIPKGVVCRSALFGYARSGKYFNDPLNFRPQRWLPPDHPKYDAAFSKDDHSGHFPFALGPRQCPGREVAWIEARLFITKILWSFDVEMVPGQNLDYEKDFISYVMWIKPEMRVRFVPVRK